MAKASDIVYAVTASGTNIQTPILHRKIHTNYKVLCIVYPPIRPRDIASREAQGRLDTSLLNTREVLLVMNVVEAFLLSLLFNSVHVDLSNGAFTIKDTGDFLKSGTLGLRVDEVHPDKLDHDPALFLD